MTQLETIGAFCSGSKYYMIKFGETKDGELGKILQGVDLLTIDLSKNEIWRSVENQNEDFLFVYDLRPLAIEQKTDNPLQLLMTNLEEARVIERVYPDIFTWIFNGVNIKAYATVPSGNFKAHSTISRYGGTETFIRVLGQHLRNISRMHKGVSPNYNFLQNNEDIPEIELSIGSINMFNQMYSIAVDIKKDYIEILNKSLNNVQEEFTIRELDMKYWAKEINPDFLSETKHIKLDNSLTIEEGMPLYPFCIQNLMSMETKGNHSRWLLARFLLSVHKPHDAKFVYYSVLSPAELDHVKNGNCSGQWNHVMNNFKKYSCPTMRELLIFKDPRDGNLSHPLEKIQEFLNKKEVIEE